MGPLSKKSQYCLFKILPFFLQIMYQKGGDCGPKACDGGGGARLEPRGSRDPIFR